MSEEILNKIEELKRSCDCEPIGEASDDAVSLCLRILNDERFKYQFSVNEKERLIFRTNLCHFCEAKNCSNKDSKYNTSVLNDLLDDNSPAGKHVIFSDSVNDFPSIGVDDRVSGLCFDCIHSDCIYVLLALMTICKENGSLEEKIAARTNSIGRFKFQWGVNDGLSRIPEDVYQKCKFLYENNITRLMPYLDQNGKMKINSSFRCSTCDFESLFKSGNTYIDNSLEYVLRRSPNCRVFCSNCGSNCYCGMPHCPIVVAGYIDYLINTNQAHVLEEQRAKYFQLEQQMKELEDVNSAEMIVPPETDPRIDKKALSMFDKFKGKVENVELLANMVADTENKQLYFAIEVEDEISANELIDTVEEALRYLKKIKKDVKRNATHEDDSINWDALQTRHIDPKEDLWPIQGRFAKVTQSYITPQHNRYVLLYGNKQQLERFCATESAGRIYKKFRVRIPVLTTDELFALYKSNLKSQLLVYLEANEERIKKQFVDYIAKVRGRMPFRNKWLANYMAYYANAVRKIEFPKYNFGANYNGCLVDDIIGQQKVKDTANELNNFIDFAKRAKEQGMHAPMDCFNMVFIGDKGTGKTSVGKILANKLYEEGITSDNSFVTSDGTHKGSICGVLEVFLTWDEEKEEVSKASTIRGLLAHYMDNPNVVVIISGDRKSVDAFYKNYPDIFSRIGYIFEFDNYNADDLIDILNQKVKDYGFKLHEDAYSIIKPFFISMSQRKKFTNGHFVEQFLRTMLLKHAKTCTGDIELIMKDAVPTIDEFHREITKRGSVDDAFKNVVGLSNIKDRLKEILEYVQFSNTLNDVGAKIPAMNNHMIFAGNPGTGKTMIARIVAKSLFDIGAIRENKLVEVDRKDLISKYSGQTALQTYSVVKKALGGVLFIDEAYSLTQNNDREGRDCIATLIKALEDHKDDLVVIFAGYEKEMSQFVDSNPGLASRIGHHFLFHDYSNEELGEIFVSKLNQIGLTTDSDAIKSFIYLVKQFSGRRNFGNGRFVDHVVQKTLLKHSKTHGEDLLLVTAASIPDEDDLRTSKRNEEEIFKELDKLIGLESIKEQVREFAAYIKFEKEVRKHGIDLPILNNHMVFTGNAGTGKTIVARLMAEMLFNMGLIHENKLVEVDRHDLIAEYLGQTATKTTSVINRAMGGVLFIDEAYAIARGTRDSYGDESLATITKAMEDYRDDIVIIFAGYEEEMRQFIDLNPGISSRIGYTFRFPDYTTDELMQIFELKLSKTGMSIEDNAYNRVKRIVEIYSKRKNFGNGRFIDKLLQNMLMNHAKNYCLNNLTALVEDDVPTMDELVNTGSSGARGTVDLSDIVGMANIKRQIEEFTAYVKFVEKAKNKGMDIPNANMHMLFTGNPGTGKTMIARLMAKMLYDLGVLHENKLVEVDRKDLVGEHMGETAIKTSAVIDSAIGGVLFIDEAYSLAPKTSYRDIGQESIATLIKAMEDHKDNLIVIFAGYEEEMDTFVRSNPGINSRIGYKFHFDDYDSSELMEMLRRKINKTGMILADDAESEILHIIENMSKRSNFGNGRFVDTLFQKILTNHALHMSDEIEKINRDSIPRLDEIISKNHVPEKEKQFEIDDLVGLTELKDKLKEFSDYIEFSQRARMSGLKLPMTNMHMLFTGNPGCGKTTVARIVAKMLFDMQVLPENKLIEVERKDLVAEWIGQTAPKTAAVIERAIGGVLFIDEAYALTPADSFRDFGKEAIATLIKAMEDRKGEFVVIFAGYRKEMSVFLNSNSGIASRIGYTFDFPDYTPEELTQIYELKMKKSGFELSDDVNPMVLKIMNYFHRVEGIGNGRFVDKVAQNTLIKHAQNKPENLALIVANDLPTIEEIIKTLANQSSVTDPSKITEEVSRAVSIHEIGHAYIRYKLYNNPQFVKITINSEGNGTLGYVRYDDDSGSIQSKSELLNAIKVSLAGMCSEEVFYGEFFTGNGSDLEKATGIARRIVTKHGMSRLGFAQINDDKSPEVQKEISAIMQNCYDQIKKILIRNKSEIQKLADYLFDHKEITGDEFMELVGKKRLFRR